MGVDGVDAAEHVSSSVSTRCTPELLDLRTLDRLGSLLCLILLLLGGYRRRERIVEFGVGVRVNESIP